MTNFFYAHAFNLSQLIVFSRRKRMGAIWSDLSSAEEPNLPPEWHGRILEERSRLVESGEVGFTDWQTAKKQIKERVS
jgi:hypothetical protein